MQILQFICNKEVLLLANPQIITEVIYFLLIKKIFECCYSQFQKKSKLGPNVASALLLQITQICVSGFINSKQNSHKVQEQ